MIYPLPVIERVPPEIFDSIAGHMTSGDTELFKNCSLVSKTFNAHFHPLLFHTITISGFPKLESLHSAMDSNSKIGRNYIQILRFHLNQEDHAGVGIEATVLSFSRVLMKLQNVNHLAIVPSSSGGYRLPFDLLWPTEDGDANYTPQEKITIRNGVHHVLTLPTLRHVSSYRITFPPHLIFTSTNIRSIDLDSIRSSWFEVSTTARRSTLPTDAPRSFLQSLSLGCCALNTLTDILSSYGPRLHHLTVLLMSMWFEVFPEAINIIQACSSTLQRLEVVVHTPDTSFRPIPLHHHRCLTSFSLKLHWDYALFAPDIDLVAGVSETYSNILASRSGRNDDADSRELGSVTTVEIFILWPCDSADILDCGKTHRECTSIFEMLDRRSEEGLSKAPLLRLDLRLRIGWAAYAGPTSAAPCQCYTSVLPLIGTSGSHSNAGMRDVFPFLSQSPRARLEISMLDSSYHPRLPLAPILVEN